MKHKNIIQQPINCSSCGINILINQNSYFTHQACKKTYCIFCVYQHFQSNYARFLLSCRQNPSLKIKDYLIEAKCCKKVIPKILQLYKQFIEGNCMICTKKCQGKNRYEFKYGLFVGKTCYLNIFKQKNPSKYQNKCLQTMSKLDKIKCQCGEYQVSLKKSIQNKNHNLCEKCNKIKRCSVCNEKQKILPTKDNVKTGFFSSSLQIIKPCLQITQINNQFICYWCLFQKAIQAKKKIEKKKIGVIEYLETLIMQQSIFCVKCVVCGQNLNTGKQYKTFDFLNKISNLETCFCLDCYKFVTCEKSQLPNQPFKRFRQHIQKYFQGQRAINFKKILIVITFQEFTSKVKKNNILLCQKLSKLKPIAHQKDQIIKLNQIKYKIQNNQRNMDTKIIKQKIKQIKQPQIKMQQKKELNKVQVKYQMKKQKQIEDKRDENKDKMHENKGKQCENKDKNKCEKQRKQIQQEYKPIAQKLDKRQQVQCSQLNCNKNKINECLQVEYKANISVKKQQQQIQISVQQEQSKQRIQDNKVEDNNEIKQTEDKQEQQQLEKYQNNQIKDEQLQKLNKQVNQIQLDKQIKQNNLLQQTSQLNKQQNISYMTKQYEITTQSIYNQTKQTEQNQQQGQSNQRSVQSNQKQVQSNQKQVQSNQRQIQHNTNQEQQQQIQNITIIESGFNNEEQLITSQKYQYLQQPIYTQCQYQQLLPYQSYKLINNSQQSINKLNHQINSINIKQIKQQIISYTLLLPFNDIYKTISQQFNLNANHNYNTNLITKLQLTNQLCKHCQLNQQPILNYGSLCQQCFIKYLLGYYNSNQLQQVQSHIRN